MTTHADVVAEARTWIDTPVHHQARIKHVGVDCIGLVIGVARELGLVEPTFDIGAYPRDPDSVSLLAKAREHMTEIPYDEAVSGDVLVITFNRDPQHFCILAEYRPGVRSVIHAASNANPGRVVETRLMFSAVMRRGAAFRLPGVA